MICSGTFSVVLENHTCDNIEVGGWDGKGGGGQVEQNLQ